MGTDAAIDRVKKKLLRSFAPSITRAPGSTASSFLAAGLAAFNTPVPRYELTFRHLPQLNLGVHELASDEPRI